MHITIFKRNQKRQQLIAILQKKKLEAQRVEAVLKLGTAVIYQVLLVATTTSC